MKRIGHYTVLDTLGSGGMGTVFLCHDPKLDRNVAIKLIQKESRTSNTGDLRFLREALTTARLQHPGIPPVYGVDSTEDGIPYYIMKPIQGVSLQEILDRLRAQHLETRRSFDLFRLVDILREVCQALEYAHQQHFIHRDLKPSNIFVGHFGEVYIIDWGLTKGLESNQVFDTGPLPDLADISLSPLSRDCEPSAITLEGDILGTPAYMAPEQAQGTTRDLGPATDIYALGVILYEILTLELPIEGPNLDDLFRRKQEGSILQPEERTPYRSIPPELSSIAMQAMNVAPADRISSAAQFHHMLTFWVEGKARFRTAYHRKTDQSNYTVFPRSTRKSWSRNRGSFTTRPLPKEEHKSYLLFNHDFSGDIRVHVDVLAQPDEKGRISEFGILLNAVMPKAWSGYLDCYSIHFAGNLNTRASLCKNDSEVESNEYVFFEPRRRYTITVERIEHEIRVSLSGQEILFYQDALLLGGLSVGFLHCGQGIHLDAIRIESRGLPTLIPSIEVPEALMQEGCYEAALKRFLTLAHAHKARREGAWARLRAGLAAYKASGDLRRPKAIWAPLKSGHYAIYAQLGPALVELDKAPQSPEAARRISRILKDPAAPPHLEQIASVVFPEVQNALRIDATTPEQWRIVDTWARLGLLLGLRLESRRSMLPSILWRWILLALPHGSAALRRCTVFLHRNLGKGRGPFAEILTTIDPLIVILQRAAKMSDHAFLLDKVMKLILMHDDHLGNLETLARFYLHSRHERVCRAINRHILKLCEKHNYTYPPMPITYVAVYEWLKGNRRKARALFTEMTSNSDSWATWDGLLFLGLDQYYSDHHEQARKLWEQVRDDPEAPSFNRHLVAKGLLGELPPDPEQAGVPNRSDHQLLFCLLLGYRYWIDWKHSGRSDARSRAVSLLSRVLHLLGPSYDIYSATDTFARVPLEDMGSPVSSSPNPPPLTAKEESWIRQLAKAATFDDGDRRARGASHASPPQE